MLYAILTKRFYVSENGEKKSIDTIGVCIFTVMMPFVCGTNQVYVKCSDGKWRIHCIIRRTSQYINDPENQTIERIAKAMIPEMFQVNRVWGQKTDDECKELLWTEDYSVIERNMQECNMVPFEPYESNNLNFPAKLGKLSNVDEIEAIELTGEICLPKVHRVELRNEQHGTAGLSFIENTGREMTYYNWATRYDKDLVDWYNKHFCKDANLPILRDSLPPLVHNNKFIKCKVTNDDNSILIKRFCITETVTDNYESVFNIEKIGELYYNISGEGNYCKKILKRSEREVGTFEMFNINSKTIWNPDDSYVFKNAENVNEWFLKNTEFCKRCGFFNFVSSMKGTINLLGGLVLYLSIIFDYSSIELLVKSGYVSLVEEFFSSVMQAAKKEVIVDKVRKIEELIDRNATKGSAVLRFPQYIGDYLRSVNASFSTYKFWRDIYEIENISKENFDKFISMPERVLLNLEVRDNGGPYNDGWSGLGLQDIIKYDGYNLVKTVKYAVKMVQKSNENADNAVTGRHINRYANGSYNIMGQLRILKDTLEMAEVLGIDVEPYPDNLNAIHDELAVLQRQKMKQIEDGIVKKTAETCRETIEKVFSSESVTLPKKAMERLTYIFPESQKEFTEEGIKQHNCVAGYASRVTRGDCIIFFVREKEDVESSYITVEITLNGLAQVMYSNNRRVPPSSQDYAFCDYIAKRILEAYDRDKICAFKKIARFNSEIEAEKNAEQEVA